MQDRSVKELGLAGVRTLAEGNALLPAFMDDYNARVAKPPANQKNLHRPLRAGDDLVPSEPVKAAIDKYVTVFDYPYGRPAIRHRGVDLAHRTFDKVRQVDQGAIANNKHLGQYWR